MRVHQVGVARRAPRVSRERRKERRHQCEPPRLRTQVLRDPAAVRDPVVREVGGRDDVDIGAGGPRCVDLRGDEMARNVARVARERRRHDDDLHSRAKTSGTASASATNA